MRAEACASACVWAQKGALADTEGGEKTLNMGGMSHTPYPRLRNKYGHLGLLNLIQHPARPIPARVRNM